MNQDEKKQACALKAVSILPRDCYIGVGTGSTVDFFIDALSSIKDSIKGAVSTSPRSAERLRSIGIRVVDLSESGILPIYVDGADEINHSLQMIKGGGGALLGEKVVASMSERFVCIADESKYVSRLGKFPLPVEVAPLARSAVVRELIKLGGTPHLRVGFKTESAHEILDVSGLNLDRPLTMEDKINQIVGVMENGLFARQAAHLLLLADAKGVQMISPQ